MCVHGFRNHLILVCCHHGEDFVCQKEFADHLERRRPLFLRFDRTSAVSGDHPHLKTPRHLLQFNPLRGLRYELHTRPSVRPTADRVALEKLKESEMRLHLFGEGEILEGDIDVP